MDLIEEDPKGVHNTCMFSISSFVSSLKLLPLESKHLLHSAATVFLP